MRPVTGAYQDSSPERVIEEVTAFRDELRSMGMGKNSDRLNRALCLGRAFEAALEHPDKLRALLESRSYLRVAQVLSELEDFRQIYRAFKGQLELIRPKLRRCLDGSLDVEDEVPGGSSAGRNTAFELSLASAFKLRGVEISVEDETEGDADVVCRVNGVQVRIACKRAYSEDNIPKAIKKANLQLRKGLQPGGGDVGIIAVCVSRPLYQRFQGVPTIGDPFAVDDVVRRLSEEIFSQHRNAYMKIRDEAVISIFFRLAGPIVFQGPGDPPNLTYIQVWNCRKWRELTSTQDEVLSGVGRLFNQAIPFGDSVSR